MAAVLTGGGLADITVAPMIPITAALITATNTGGRRTVDTIMDGSLCLPDKVGSPSSGTRQTRRGGYKACDKARRRCSAAVNLTRCPGHRSNRASEMRVLVRIFLSDRPTVNG